MSQKDGLTSDMQNINSNDNFLLIFHPLGAQILIITSFS